MFTISSAVSFVFIMVFAFVSLFVMMKTVLDQNIKQRSFASSHRPVRVPAVSDYAFEQDEYIVDSGF